MAEQAYWRRCSTCKGEIGFDRAYYACNVSTCNRDRTGLVFCSVPCWDSHVPILRHREAWAEDRRSPTRAEWERLLEPASASATDRGQEAFSAERAPRVATSQPSVAPAPTTLLRSGESVRPAAAPPAVSREATGVTSAAPVALGADYPRDVLVVVSKLKAYIRARSEMNTSDGVVDVLSDHLRRVCDDAIRRAMESGRKTVLDRDFDL